MYVARRPAKIEKTRGGGGGSGGGGCGRILLVPGSYLKWKAYND